MLIWLNWETLLTLLINSISDVLLHFHSHTSAGCQSKNMCRAGEKLRNSFRKHSSCVSNRLNSSCDGGVTFTVAVTVNSCLSAGRSLGFVCRWQMCLLFTVCDGFSENKAECWRYSLKSERSALVLVGTSVRTTCRSFKLIETICGETASHRKTHSIGVILQWGVFHGQWGVCTGCFPIPYAVLLPACSEQFLVKDQPCVHQSNTERHFPEKRRLPPDIIYIVTKGNRLQQHRRVLWDQMVLRS